MKRLYHTIAAAMLTVFLLPANVYAAEYLIPGGQVIGLRLENKTVTIAAFDDTIGAEARDAGLKIGDELLSINDTAITGATDVPRILSRGDGPVTLTVRRNGKNQSVSMSPVRTELGPRLGIYLRQGISGIGTVTWYDPGSGVFGTLGHGVNDGKGKLLAMTGGTAFQAQVVSVKKGLCGEPGQLKGDAQGEIVRGALLRNTPQGLFGTATAGWQGQAMPVADYAEIQTGGASIRSTVSGNTVQEYSVEILKIYPEDRRDGRNFLIRVTDPALLGITGGIVQGMSGSPILQDGRIVGAVTHVLVNDPTMGYGIFIGNMLDAAA